jgi:galactokinase
MEKLPELRKTCSGRALLRAIHFFNENRRAAEEADALEQHDYERFLRLVNESAHSSWEYLQNITPAGEIKEQAVALTIALIRQILGGKGAVRVHGGGFAGTVQAYVPLEMTAEMIEKTEAVLGKGSCHIMAIRPYGGIRVL